MSDNSANLSGGDSRRAEYEAKRVSVQLALRRYYNECVIIMAKEEAGELPMDDALKEFLRLDAEFSKQIVDDISPLKKILEL